MNKSCFDLSELIVTGSTGTTGIVGSHIGLLDIAFQCSLHINKITSWYQLFDCFEDLYYYFIKLDCGLPTSWDSPGNKSTFVE